MAVEKQDVHHHKNGAFTKKAGVSDAFSQERATPKTAMGMTDEAIEEMYGQAYRLYNSGNYADAVHMFRLLVMLNPMTSKYTLGLAACMHMTHEFRNAIELYTTCAALDTESPFPLFHLSDCYLKIQDQFSALVALEMAVKRAGERAEYKVMKDRALLTMATLRQDLKKQGVLK